MCGRSQMAVVKRDRVVVVEMPQKLDRDTLEHIHKRVRQQVGGVGWNQHWRWKSVSEGMGVRPRKLC